MDHTKLFSTFWILLLEIDKQITEFQEVMKNDNLKKQFKYIDWAYMGIILINLCKILSWTANDKYWIKQLKNCCPENVRKEIELIENENWVLIKRIISNRNSTVVHTSWSDYDLLFFSYSEKEKFSKEVAKYIEKPRTKDEERYTTLNFEDDLFKIKIILDKLTKIFNQVIKYYYSHPKQA